jgi:hypothetical protein
MRSRLYWSKLRFVAAMAAVAVVAIPESSTAFLPSPEYFCCKRPDDPANPQQCSGMSLTAEKCQEIIERTDRAQAEWAAEQQRRLNGDRPQPCQEK